MRDFDAEGEARRASPRRTGLLPESGGRPLDPATRLVMERGFGAHFADVRVHTGPAADAVARAVGARAFTVGSDVVLGRGADDPGTSAGLHTLAHELAHVLQQRAGPVDGTPLGDGVSVSSAGDRFEVAASAAADALAAGIAPRLRRSAGNAAMRGAALRNAAMRGAALGESAVAGTAVRGRPATLQRDTTAPPAAPPAAPAPPHYAEGQGTLAPGGLYLVWGTWHSGDDFDSYRRRVLGQWVTWRFGRSLSAAARAQILRGLTDLRYRVLQREPVPGKQYYMSIERAVLVRITGIAERDPAARAAQEREQAAGLPAEGGVAEAAPPEGATATEGTTEGTTTSPPPPGQQAAGGPAPGGTTPQGPVPAEPATEAPSGSEFEGGPRTANAAALPASMSGPDIQPTHSIGTYTMRLDYSIAGRDQLSQLAEAMNSVHYHWEIFRVTELIQAGLEEQLAAQRNRPVSDEAAVGRLDPAARRAEQAGEQLTDETVAAAGELAHPVEAAHGGTAADVITRAQANLTSLELLPVSAIVALGGVALGAIADIFGGDRHEQEVPFPRGSGYYLIRCIAQPRPGNRRRRAASVAVKVVQARTVGSLARAAVELPHALVTEKELELEVARRQGASPERLTTLERELNERQLTAGGAATDVIALRIRQKEEELASTPDWRRGPVERQLKALREQQEHATDRAGSLRGRIWRPEAAIVSRLDGQTYPLLLQLGLVAGAEGEVWRLSDVSTADGRQWIGRGATATEAVRNAARLMARGNSYGPGSLAVRFPAEAPFDAGELVLDNINTGTALARQRLADLAAVLAILGLLVPGVGEIAAVVGAAVAADRLLDRWQNGSLRLDADTIGDLVGVLGAAAQGVSAIGRARILRLADRFVVATSEADQAAILAAVRSTSNVVELAGRAGEIANWGGYLFGSAVTLTALMDVNRQELSGGLSHAEARRKRAGLLLGAVRDATLQFAPAPQARQGEARTGEPPRVEPARGEPPRPEPPRPEPPRVEPPRVEPPRVEPPRAEPPTVEPPRPEPPTVEPPRPEPPPAAARPVEPGRLARLEPELGPLAGQIPLVENPGIGSSVLVRYVDGQLRMEIGPEATARHVRAHIGTARVLSGYRGPVGVIRRLFDRIGTLLRLSPGYGTRGFEARLEVSKLNEIKAELVRMLQDLDVRSAQLSQDEHAAAREAESLRGELAAVEAQLAQFETMVDSYEPGRGFVAALDAATLRHFGAQARDVQTILRGLARAGRPELVAVLENVARHEAAGGNIRGFSDWIQETGSRLRGPDQQENLRQVIDKASELVEVWRLSQQVRNDPSMVVRFNPGAPGARSFDIHVEARAPGGAQTTRQVEVKEHTGIPTGSRSLNGPIGDAAAKVPPAAAGPPGQGTARTEPVREATIVTDWFAGGTRDLPTGTGAVRMDEFGNFRPLGGTPPTPRGTARNLAEDLVADLRLGRLAPRVDFLDYINIVSPNGRLLWRFVNLGTAAAPNWQWAR